MRWAHGTRRGQCPPYHVASSEETQRGPEGAAAEQRGTGHCVTGSWQTWQLVANPPPPAVLLQRCPLCPRTHVPQSQMAPGNGGAIPGTATPPSRTGTSRPGSARVPAPDRAAAWSMTLCGPCGPVYSPPCPPVPGWAPPGLCHCLALPSQGQMEPSTPKAPQVAWLRFPATSQHRGATFSSPTLKNHSS